MADHMSRIRTGEAPTGVDDELPDAPLFHVDFAPEWYPGLVEFLMNGHPPEGMSKTDVRWLLRQAEPYQLIVGQLYRRCNDDVLHICVLPQEVDDVLRECHDGVAGGHLGPEAMTRKVRLAGLWWPTLNKDATNYVKMCDVCQRLAKPRRWTTWSYILSLPKHHSRNGA